eukprot:1662280-Pyramimonas_sp.AAC.1
MCIRDRASAAPGAHGVASGVLAAWRATVNSGRVAAGRAADVAQQLRAAAAVVDTALRAAAALAKTAEVHNGHLDRADAATDGLVDLARELAVECSVEPTRRRC